MRAVARWAVAVPHFHFHIPSSCGLNFPRLKSLCVCHGLLPDIRSKTTLDLAHHDLIVTSGVTGNLGVHDTTGNGSQLDAVSLAKQLGVLRRTLDWKTIGLDLQFAGRKVMPRFNAACLIILSCALRVPSLNSIRRGGC